MCAVGDGHFSGPGLFQFPRKERHNVLSQLTSFRFCSSLARKGCKAVLAPPRVIKWRTSPGHVPKMPLALHCPKQTLFNPSLCNFTKVHVKSQHHNHQHSPNLQHEPASYDGKQILINQSSLWDIHKHGIVVWFLLVAQYSAHKDDCDLSCHHLQNGHRGKTQHCGQPP